MLRPSEVKVILCFEDKETLTANEIFMATDMMKSTIYDALRDLEQKGMVEVATLSPKKAWRLTEKGRRCLQWLLEGREKNCL